MRDRVRIALNLPLPSRATRLGFIRQFKGWYPTYRVVHIEKKIKEFDYLR